MSSETRNQESNDEQLQELMRAAGKRPKLDPEHMERARARVKREWRAHYQAPATETRAPRWKSFSLLAAAALVTVVALAGWWAVQDAPSIYEIHVEAAAGDAWVLRDSAGQEVRSPLSRGDVLMAGERITTSSEGRVGLRLPDGRSVKLDRRSQVAIRSGVAVLSAGALYIDSPPSVSAPGLTVETPLAEFEEIGTQFEVRIENGDSQASLRVREGKVRASSGSRELQVEAGTQLIVNAEGEWSESQVSASAPAWDWLLDVLPAFELEGRTAAEFLSWSSRQLGVEVRYADVEAANAARNAVLSGSIEGIPLKDALDSVLLTCNLAYRDDGGALMVWRTNAQAN